MCFSGPCPQDDCANVSCPAGLVRHICAPCPLTCAHVSGATTCDHSSRCFSGELSEYFTASLSHRGPFINADTVVIYCKYSNDCTVYSWLSVSSDFFCCFVSGCWCPDGKVMNHEQQCVRPEECVCEVSGVRYWPGQQVKVSCDICVCERGRAQRCHTNPECSGEHTHMLAFCELLGLSIDVYFFILTKQYPLNLNLHSCVDVFLVETGLKHFFK